VGVLPLVVQYKVAPGVVVLALTEIGAVKGSVAGESTGVATVGPPV